MGTMQLSATEIVALDDQQVAAVVEVFVAAATELGGLLPRMAAAMLTATEDVDGQRMFLMAAAMAIRTVEPD